MRNLKGEQTPKFIKDNSVSKISCCTRCITENEFKRCSWADKDEDETVEVLKIKMMTN